MILLEQLYLSAQFLDSDPTSLELLKRSIEVCKADYINLHLSSSDDSYTEKLGYRKPSQEESAACLSRWAMIESLALSQHACNNRAEILSHIIVLITIHKELSRVSGFSLEES